MTYTYMPNKDNVHLIDAVMFGFDRFQACYLIKDEQITLVDTGPPKSLPDIRSALTKLGVAVADIDHIFVTHCEHPDHSGNAGALLTENSKATVYCHPLGVTYLTHPEIEADTRNRILPPEMAERFGEMVPVPENRIHVLADGEKINIGGKALETIFTPGHQPSGYVLYDAANQGMFINDLMGLYLKEAGFSLILTPNRSEVKQYITSLNLVRKRPVKTLFMGHFGISENPDEVLDRALGLMQSLLDIGAECMAAGKPDEIAPRFREFVAPQLEKLRAVRGEALHAYVKNELVASCSEAFSRYYQGLQ